MKLLALLLLAASILPAEVCPFCVKDKAKSEVEPGICTRTQMGWRAHYDAAGVFHNDDPNYSICDFACSKGHEYRRKMGPGNAVGPAELVNLNIETLQKSEPVQKSSAAKSQPTRILVCTINAEKFRVLKEDLVGCQRGNCAGAGVDPIAAVAKFLDAVECR